MFKKKKNLSSRSKTAMKITLIHPAMQITNPQSLILSIGSMLILMILMLMWRHVQRLLKLMMMVVIRHIWRRRVMLRWHHVMWHYHRRCWILHRNPLLWYRHRCRWLLSLLLVRCLGRRWWIWTVVLLHLNQSTVD